MCSEWTFQHILLPCSDKTCWMDKMWRQCIKSDTFCHLSDKTCCSDKTCRKRGHYINVKEEGWRKSGLKDGWLFIRGSNVSVSIIVWRLGSASSHAVSLLHLLYNNTNVTVSSDNTYWIEYKENWSLHNLVTDCLFSEQTDQLSNLLVSRTTWA